MSVMSVRFCSSLSYPLHLEPLFLFQVIMALSLASMDLVVMGCMMRQQVEKERTVLIPSPKLVGGLGGKHVHAPTVKIVKEGEFIFLNIEFIFVLFIYLVLWTEFHCLALAVLELALCRPGWP